MKPIPLLCEEQVAASQIIESQQFERPVLKTVRRYFGDGISLYGGRKGFTDLMLERGHSLESISQ